MRKVRRTPCVAFAVALLLLSAAPITSTSPPATTWIVCGTDYEIVEREGCIDQLARCTMIERRPVGQCIREFFACLGPWGGSPPGGP